VVRNSRNSIFMRPKRWPI